MEQSWMAALITAQADGPALTAAAAASALGAQAKSLVLPNGFLIHAGNKLKLRASGRISCVATTPGTARFDLRFGGVVVFDTLAMNLNVVAKTNVPWILDVDLTARTVGNSTIATLMGQGTFTSEACVGAPLPTAGGSGQFVVPYNVAPSPGTGFDSTSALAVDLFFTQTVATGSMTLHQFDLISVL